VRRQPELQAINQGAARNEGYANAVRADGAPPERRR
jgi:hypothetical protein